MGAQMAYTWRAGSRFSIKAQVAGEEISRIRAEHGKLFKSSHIVEASQPEDAPLHTAFEWDDARAATAHREDQARHIIRHINVVNVQNPERPPTRAFVSVHDDEGDQQFTTVAYALSQSTLREQLLRAAERDMKTFEERYQHLLDLANMVSAFRVAHTRAAALPETQAS